MVGGLIRKCVEVEKGSRVKQTPGARGKDHNIDMLGIEGKEWE